MTGQTVLIVFCVMCLGVTMIVVERLRPGRKFPRSSNGESCPKCEGLGFWSNDGQGEALAGRIRAYCESDRRLAPWVGRQDSRIARRGLS